MERWKEVKETNGMIMVSDMGRVKSLLRDERILKSQKDSKGYHRVSITINKCKRTYKVHRLVAQAFIDNPYNLTQVNHIDGNKDNNSVNNLEWITNKDNCHHAIATGLWSSNIAGAARENEKRMKAIVGIKGEVVMHFKSIAEAERYIKSRHITDVLKGKRLQAKGWSFSYERG